MAPKKDWYLRFEIQDLGGDETLIHRVEKKTAERLELVLSSLDLSKSKTRFFWFDTLDGRSLMINLRCVQAIRVLWEPGQSGPKLKLVSEEDSDIELREIDIRLKNRAEHIEECTEMAEEFHDLFFGLEIDEEPRFHYFTDMDGETFWINSEELVYIDAARSLLDEGRPAEED